MAGLPGTGKSTLAEALVQRLGGVVLSKDTVRSEVFAPAEIDYSSAQKTFVMSLVLNRAQSIAKERSQPFVFLDGRTFSRAQHVEEVVRAAQQCGAETRIIYLHCPEQLALERIERDRWHVAADRDALLYSQVKSHFEPIVLPKLELDTSRPLQECVERCVRYLTH